MGSPTVPPSTSATGLPSRLPLKSQSARSTPLSAMMASPFLPKGRVDRYIRSQRPSTSSASSLSKVSRNTVSTTCTPAEPPPPTPKPGSPSSGFTVTRICPSEVRQSGGEPGVDGCEAVTLVIFTFSYSAQSDAMPVARAVRTGFLSSACLKASRRRQELLRFPPGCRRWLLA